MQHVLVRRLSMAVVLGLLFSLLVPVAGHAQTPVRSVTLVMVGQGDGEVTEGDGEVHVSFGLGTGTGVPVVLDFSLSGSGASLSATTSLTLPANQTWAGNSTAVRITPDDDNVIQEKGYRSVFLTATSATPGVVVINNNLELRILDNDGFSFSFTPNLSGGVDERSMSESSDPVQLGVTLPSARSDDVVVEFSLSGSAASLSSTRSVTVSAGQTSNQVLIPPMPVTLTPDNDAVIQVHPSGAGTGFRTAVLRATARGGLVGTRTVDIKVVDDDGLRITTVPSGETGENGELRFSESAGRVFLNVELDRPPASDTEVVFSLSGHAPRGSAVHAPEGEVSVSSQTLTVPAGDTTGTGPQSNYFFSVSNDMLDQDAVFGSGDRAFVLTATLSNGTTVSRDIVIEDDDRFSTRMYAVEDPDAEEDPDPDAEELPALHPLPRGSGILYAVRWLYATDQTAAEREVWDYILDTVCPTDGFVCDLVRLNPGKPPGIGLEAVVRCASDYRCRLSVPSRSHSATGPPEPVVRETQARPLNERVVSTAEGREIYRIRFDVADETSRQEKQHDAVFDAVCPGSTRGVVFTCETFGHYLDDGIDVDGDGVFEVSGTMVGVTLVVTCNPGYSCSRPRVTTVITTDPETGVVTTDYKAQADWVHEPGRKFYREVFKPAATDAAKTTAEKQADAVQAAVCSWPDTAVFMCDHFEVEVRDADTNGDGVINADDAVTEETFVVSCNTGYRCRGPHLSVTADGVWSAEPTWRDVRDREVYRVSYRAVAVTTPVTPVTTAQKQYDAVVLAAGCDSDGTGASTPGLWCETFPTTNTDNLVTGRTLVVSCITGFRCVRPRVTAGSDGTHTAVVSAQEIVPPAQQPARGRPVAARISSVRVVHADLNNDGDTTDVYDVLVNGAPAYTVAEVDPFFVVGVDEPVCAVTGFSWYGDPRSQFIAPSNSGPRPADWLDDPLNTVANTKRDIWPVGRPADRDRYDNGDGTFDSVLERPIYEYPDAQGKCYATYQYFLVQQGSRWVVRRTPVPHNTSSSYDGLGYDTQGLTGTFATITAPYLPKPAEPACLHAWRASTPFDPNGYSDYCSDAELDAYDAAVEQWSANVDATYGRRGYDPDVNPVINDDGTRDGREPTTPVEGTYPDQRQQLEQRQQEPYLECISEEEWALLVGWWGPRCSLIYPSA